MGNSKSNQAATDVDAPARSHVYPRFMMEKGRKLFAIGIDLGTTHSCVAAWKRTEIEILENKQGNRTTPSQVAFTETDELVGEGAKNQSASNRRNTIFGIKRLMGRSYHDTFVQKQVELFPFNVMSREHGSPRIVVSHKGEERKFSPEDISTMILRHMKEAAEEKLGGTVKDAVITVPANFSYSQRRATKNAGEAAGLNVLRILNEPTAAAITYYLKEASWATGKRNVLVFDLGGGTLDVSIIVMENVNLSIRATAGDTHLGGLDFDDRMLCFLIDEVKKGHGVDISGSPKALGRMRAECERAKKDLSFSDQTSIDLEYIHRDIESFHYRFTRAKFEDLNKDYFSRCMDVVEKCLVDAKMHKGDIHDVVLAGGSTRIPKVQELLGKLFGMNKLRCTVNPDEVVAYGAAALAAKLIGSGNRKVQEITLVDVTPTSIGVSGSGGLMSVIMPGNSPIPVMKEKEFCNPYDNQTQFCFAVYEGEKLIASENNLLVDFSLGPLPPARADATKVVLGMRVDEDGLLTVSAEHKESGLRKDITLADFQAQRQFREDNTNDQELASAETSWNRSYLEILITNSRSRLKEVELQSNIRKCMERKLDQTDEWLQQNQEANAPELLQMWEQLEKTLAKHIDLKGLTTAENKFRPRG